MRTQSPARSIKAIILRLGASQSEIVRSALTLEAAGSIGAGGAVLTANIRSVQRLTLVDVVGARRSLPVRRTLAVEAVVLVDARAAVTARTALALVGQQRIIETIHAIIQCTKSATQSVISPCRIDINIGFKD